MVEKNSQEREFFALSKLDKFYVDPTPIGDMNLMAQSISLSKKLICRGREGGNL